METAENYNQELELINAYDTIPFNLSEELIELAEEIQEALKTLWAPQNRCWWTCIKLVKKLNKKWRKNMVLASSETHYWLEYKNCVICPHYYIIREEMFVSEYRNSKVEEIEINKVLKAIRPLKESYEEKFASNMYSNKEKLVKIPRVEI